MSSGNLSTTSKKTAFLKRFCLARCLYVCWVFFILCNFAVVEQLAEGKPLLLDTDADADEEPATSSADNTPLAWVPEALDGTSSRAFEAFFFCC